MEDSYAEDDSSNSSRIYRVSRELENSLESFSAAPLSQRGPEGALHINMEISPQVSILGD